MNGLTYNSIHSSTYNIIAKSVNRPILPMLRKREMVIPGRDGTIDFFKNTFEKRIIEVELAYIGTTLNNLRSNARSIASWLNCVSATKTLYFDDESEKWYNARVMSEVGLDNLFLIGRAKVQFECEPFAYASYSAYDTLYYDDGVSLYDDGHYYVNYSGTFTWESTPFSCSQYNHSTYSANLTITIVGQVINPTIKNTTVTATCTISATITAGSTTIINSDALTVTINGANKLNKMTGNFIGLATGTNELIFTGTFPSASITLTWNHKWV